MFYNAKNGRISIATGQVDYIRFGRGKRTLIVLPGVGDGIRTIRGTAQFFALMFADITDDFTVYSFSRRVNLPPHMTTRQMAADMCRAMKALGIKSASVCGVSQGGMIAQWMAIDHPGMLDALILAVTTSHPNGTLRRVVARWRAMAERGEYRKLMINNADLSYTGIRKSLYRARYTLLGNIGRPKSFARFLTEAESCLTHDTRAYLDRITCPTLIIGGAKDRIVSGRASKELAALIPGSKLYMYPNLGHGLYEEAADFHRRVAAFANSR